MSARRHIVHVVGTLAAGGVQKLVLGLADSEPLRGYRHSVICLFGVEGELHHEFRAAGIDAVGCPIPWPRRLPLPSYRAAQWLRSRLGFTFPWRMASLLSRMNADLVHTHISHRVDLQTAAVLAKARIPLVWTVHGLYAPDDPQEWHRAIMRSRQNRCRITADSGPVVENLVARELARASDIEVVHIGADVELFQTERPRDPQWRRRLNIPDDAVVFGTSGRLVEAKAHDNLIEAARLLVDREPNTRVLIAGAGPLQAMLEEKISDTGLEGHVQLLGYQADVPSFLRELDVFVLPSRSEGFPLALIEALASRLPCVATSVGGIEEMLGEHGGIVVKPDAPAELAQAMKNMISPTTRQQYSTVSQSIAQRFSFDVCGAEFARIYEALLTPGVPDGV